MRLAGGIMLGLILAAAASPAAPQAASGLSLAIYAQGQAVAQEERRLDLVAGAQTVPLPGLPPQTRPETLSLWGEGISDVEIAFAPAVDGSQLLQRMVGRPVRILRTSPGAPSSAEQGTFLGQTGAGLLVAMGDHVELVSPGAPGERILFDPVEDQGPGGAAASATLRADRAGPHTVRLSYMTGGLSWRADYVADFDPTAGRLDLDGRFAITNGSGAAVQDAAVDLVSGEVSMGGPVLQPRPIVMALAKASPRGGPTMEVVGATHVYHLPRPLTLAEGQTRTLDFLKARRVPARRSWRWTTYGFESSDQPSHAQVVVDFANRGAAGFDQPLPEGTIRVFQPDAQGRGALVGESQIGPTPTGSDLTLQLGEAYDVTVKPTLVSSQPAGPHRTRFSMTYEARNAKATPVVLDLRQGGLGDDTRVVSQSLPSRALDARTLAWSLPIPAGGSATLTVELETGTP